MRADASGHSRADAQALVNPHEVVVREVQRDRRPKVLDLLAESVGEAGKPGMLIRIVKFWRSTKLVEIWAGSGEPAIGMRPALVTRGGLYRPGPIGSAS